MLDKVKTAVYQSLDELFTLAAVDDMTGDVGAYTEKLQAIAKIADILGVQTEITSVNIDIKTLSSTRKIK